jgi:hypothetical protein
MANYDRRLNRSTGNYDNLKDLTAAVMKLHRGGHHSRDHMGVLVGVSGATCTRIINENTVRGVDVDLNAMFNSLWKITEQPDEQL